MRAGSGVAGRHRPVGRELEQGSIRGQRTVAVLGLTRVGTGDFRIATARGRVPKTTGLAVELR
jgi:hypothetical protein